MIRFVGMTGGIASGKSVVSAQLASLGVTIVDADDVSHSLYEAGGKAVKSIRREFGEEFVTADGAVDRDVLRTEVFQDALLRKRIEAITHPLIRKECLRQMNSATGIYGVLVAPLLFESEFLTESVDRFLVIDCEDKLRLSYGVARGRFSEQQIKAAMKAQMNREERLKRANDIIVNSGNIEKLKTEAINLNERYLEMFAKA